jgi:hypothetical protein
MSGQTIDFAARVVRHWFVESLWKFCDTGSSHSFAPFNSYLATQAPIEYGLYNLIDSAPDEIQVVLCDALESFVRMYIDRLDDSDFLPKVQPGHIDTLKTYIDVLSGFRLDRVVVLFTCSALSKPLSELVSGNGTCAFVSMFHSINYRQCSTTQKDELRKILSAWRNDHPGCNKILVGSMMSDFRT